MDSGPVGNLFVLLSVSCHPRKTAMLRLIFVHSDDSLDVKQQGPFLSRALSSLEKLTSECHWQLAFDPGTGYSLRI